MVIIITKIISGGVTMICEKCKINNATVHIVKISGGNKQQMRLCDKCANEFSDIPLGGELQEIDGFTFQSLLSGSVDYMSNSSKDKNQQTITERHCENCGMTYDEFKKTGLLGCSECYHIFSNTIKPVIKRVQGDSEHVGKIPTKAGKEIIGRKRILKLKEELQNAILSEEYENAAVLRDEIKMLKEKSED